MRLFVTRPLPLDPRALAGPAIDVAVFAHDRAPTRAELLEGARGAAGLVALLSDAVDGALLDALPGLRVVSNVAVGLDNIDVAACKARGVVVTHTPDALTAATADLTLALILAVARRVLEGDRLVRAGHFHGWSPTLLLGLELSGATLGLFGHGRIARAVEARARAFGMNVVFCSRSQPGSVSLDELLERSDVLSIHCPLTPETRHAIGAPQLARMKPSAILVNTARGPVLDEAALGAALAAGRLAGAGLDVYEDEPRVHPSLLGRPDVVLLPHLGSATLVTRTRMARMAVSDAASVLLGKQPAHPV